MSRERCTSVANFYSGKSIFITGGTGFLGKVLIEKILYSCPDVDKIYVLVRKSGDVAEKIIKSPAFNRLKAERPQDLTKLIAVVGNLCTPNLDMNVEDADNILENVSIVFHSAATVKFNEPLRDVIRVNVEGTRQVLELSRRMKNLEVFLYMSSAYAQLDKQVIEELVYPPPARLENVYEFLEKHEHDAKKMSKFLKGYPNTYTFSKALAETLLVEQRGSIPLVILRPSVVMPALSEPMEGWVDSPQGAVTLFTAAAKGWLRVVPGKNSVVADLIPVDYVVNMAIVAAFQCARSNEVHVFNCCSSGVNPVTWKQATSFYAEEAKKDGFNDTCLFFFMVNNSSMLNFLSFVTEILPAHFFDLLRKLRRENPRYVRSLSKLEALRQHLQMFTSTSWQFNCGRALALAALPPARAFPCCARDIPWRPYLAACHRGVVAYLFKKNNTNANAAGTYKQLDS